MNPKVDAFLKSAKKWQAEMTELRAILLTTGLSEEFKWKIPVYCYEGKNVVNIAGFKDDCRLSFFQGSLLKDPKKLLLSPGKNSQAATYFTFAGVTEIRKLKSTIKAYVKEAVALEKAGKKVAFKKELDPFPDELNEVLAKDKKLKAAFDSLTDGRKRGYLLHFSAPKQSQTRFSRIEKSRDRIMAGKGMQDCICGHSNRMPRCDGSHKNYASTLVRPAA